MQFAFVSQTFNGDDFLTCRYRHRVRTRPNRLTIQQDRTGSALSDTTAKFRTFDVKFVSQRPKQGHLRFDIQRMTLSIHRQLHLKSSKRQKK
jgi:hypothetical protein